ncbi:MAG: aspartate carbamoyltransferase catalytic subunit [Mameliella sp.]|nr:aspartate carbamoyltransferase catalytic subunit [Mameliella sp.]|tara:strand:- start:274 stop:822 length:549 start_codon:yes stop_codon:yes gene_type:complete
MTLPDAPSQTPSGWDGILDPGETIRWQGRPDSGIHLRGRDYAVMAFGLLFGGFALVWMALVWSVGGSFWMFGLLHFAVGVAIVLWPLLGRPYLRRHTWYTLTNQRAFIAANVPLRGKTLKSYPISKDSPLTLEAGTLGSVFFAIERQQKSKSGYRDVRIGFEYIADAREIFGLFRDIQRGAA